MEGVLTVRFEVNFCDGRFSCAGSRRRSVQVNRRTLTRLLLIQQVDS